VLLTAVEPDPGAPGPRHLSASGPSQIPASPASEPLLDGQHDKGASAPSDYSLAGRRVDAPASL